MSEHVNIGEVFSTFDRNTIASAVEVLVAVLDAMDGEPDQEDATDLEDDFALSSPNAQLGGPGCLVSDNDSCPAGDDRIYGSDDGAGGDVDDAEEDDPSGQCDEDGINTDLRVRWQDYGPGCAISDPDYGIDDQPHDEEPG
ncbi:hypothetical protein U8326_10090 [Tsuneonella sp. CC-YZS046]|uniref:hypothetical protein n=1 Tax=Tsuneonella sp. CC-YZS046 TaxID=3042152 RepID=UPI002D77F08E|nr:hypothetical protein [Tsuneonella sp. CC-YZS046]WRO65411.1 hypothetical protein U8326_10090 [Tsuneonella sp. CC-YZS046]